MAAAVRLWGTVWHWIARTMWSVSVGSVGPLGPLGPLTLGMVQRIPVPSVGNDGGIMAGPLAVSCLI